MQHSDTNDSADTIKWILEQPWSNGEIYQIGASADGIASFELALAPPELLSGTLKAQFIIFATAEGETRFGESSFLCFTTCHGSC